MTRDKSSCGRVYDPVFIFMVIAVVLAVGSSVALRCISPTMGPSAAQGSEGGELSGSTPAAFMQPLPVPASAKQVAVVKGH